MIFCGLASTLSGGLRLIAWVFSLSSLSQSSLQL